MIFSQQPEWTKTGSFLSIWGAGSHHSGGPRCRHTPSTPLASPLHTTAVLCQPEHFLSLPPVPEQQEAATTRKDGELMGWHHGALAALHRGERLTGVPRCPQDPSRPEPWPPLVTGMLHALQASFSSLSCPHFLLPPVSAIR